MVHRVSVDSQAIRYNPGIPEATLPEGARAMTSVSRMAKYRGDGDPIASLDPYATESQADDTVWRLNNSMFIRD